MYILLRSRAETLPYRVLDTATGEIYPIFNDEGTPFEDSIANAHFLYGSMVRYVNMPTFICRKLSLGYGRGNVYWKGYLYPFNFVRTIDLLEDGTLLVQSPTGVHVLGVGTYRYINSSTWSSVGVVEVSIERFMAILAMEG